MVAKDHPHPLDVLVNDPSGRAPLCDEAEFAELVETMVADSAPRLFAIVQEYGERVDAKFAAWGLAFDDHVDAIGTGGAVHVGAPSADSLLKRFHFGSHITPRIVWVKPAD